LLEKKIPDCDGRYIKEARNTSFLLSLATFETPQWQHWRSSLRHHKTLQTCAPAPLRSPSQVHLAAHVKSIVALVQVDGVIDPQTSFAILAAYGTNPHFPPPLPHSKGASSLAVTSSPQTAEQLAVLVGAAMADLVATPPDFASDDALAALGEALRGGSVAVAFKFRAALPSLLATPGWFAAFVAAGAYAAVLSAVVAKRAGLSDVLLQLEAIGALKLILNDEVWGGGGG
jgi:hypothetical protein